MRVACAHPPARRRTLSRCVREMRWLCIGERNPSRRNELALAAVSIQIDGEGRLFRRSAIKFPSAASGDARNGERSSGGWLFARRKTRQFGTKADIYGRTLRFRSPARNVLRVVLIRSTLISHLVYMMKLCHRVLIIPHLNPHLARWDHFRSRSIFDFKSVAN